ncbi:MAG: zinc finger Ran-binding domain-containing protein [Gammaproteobacteria bacterium]|nr:zinc finger Ran-binding domain-containing protein [Gammaproteobacteria bacterium]
MVGYRWTCNACSASNEANTDICAQCGCSATASGDDIARHIDPEGYKKKEAEKIYEASLARFLFSPFFLVLFALTGRLEMLGLLIISVVISVRANIELIKFNFSNMWFRRTFLTISALLTLLIFARIGFISDDSSLVGWIAFGIVLLLVITYYILFKSRRGKELFDRYYQKNGS